MVYLLGMDLGATTLDFVIASMDGMIVFDGHYPSPFQILDSSQGIVLVDTMLKNVHPAERVSYYIREKQNEFLQKARSQGINDIQAQGIGLCGMAWQDTDKKWHMLGSNTPDRFAEKDSDGRKGVLINLCTDWPIKAANDGNAAATAQGIFYSIEHKLDPKATGYAILGTGFGFGVPGTMTPTEIGHIPVGFVHPSLLMRCGCNPEKFTSCAENYASGRGIAKTYSRVMRSKQELPELFNELCLYEKMGGRCSDLEKATETAIFDPNITAEEVFIRAQKGDQLAKWVTDIAAHVTADAIIGAAQLYGLQRVGIGESVAINNPLHVRAIARLVEQQITGNTLLQGGLIVEQTPIIYAARYGALALVAPHDKHELWVQNMTQNR